MLSRLARRGRPLALALLWLGLPGCSDAKDTRGASLPPLEQRLTAWAGPDLTLLAGQSAVFETVFTGDAVRARWDLDGDGQEDASLDLRQGPRLTLTRAYPNAGHYLASLRVEDSSGQQVQDLRQVRVAPADGVVVPGDFAPYVRYTGSVTPAVPAYSLDPAGAQNLARYPSLTARDRARLKADGFTTRATSRDHMYAIYQDAYAKQQALFISSDSALHAFHLVLTHARRRIEGGMLAGALARVTDALLARTSWQLSRARGSRVRGLLETNLAFLGLAARLLGRDYALPAGPADRVKAELALIDAHRGFALSPIFDRKQDYALFLPRGRFTRGEQLKRYFRASLWLSQVVFRLDASGPGAGAGPGQAGAHDEVLQALLLTQALYTTPAGDRPALAAWDQIHQARRFLGGSRGQLGPRQLAGLAQQVHGDRWLEASPDALADSTRLALLAQQAKILRDPRLKSDFVYGALPAAEAAPGMRLLARGFSPDTHIFQQLVYDRVSSAARKRVLPMGLDVMAALGSARARELLDGVLGQTAHAGYGAQLAGLTKQFAGLGQQDWIQDLRWGWLHALGPLLDLPAAGWPAFMRTPNWRHKGLNAALSSWAQQRQDLTLSGEQPLTPPGSATVVPVVYVEPEPELYGRLRGLAGMLRAGLEARELRDDLLNNKLAALEQLLGLLVLVAEKELSGVDPGVREMDQLRDYGSQLQRLATVADQQQETPSSGEAPRRGAAVAEVHVDPASGQTLQAAVGDPLELYVVIPYNGQPHLARGAVNSYHELTRAAADRLTDDRWQRSLADGTAPAPPGWIFP